MRSSVLAGLVLVALAPCGASAQGESAEAAYRAAMAAFERGDSDAYFGAFAPTLRCFYGARAVPLARVRRAREAALAANRRSRGEALVIAELRTVRQSADRVVLLDRGRLGTRPHEKAILMVRAEGRFLITAEGGRGSRCFAELLRSDVLDGREPLADEDGVWRALRRVTGDGTIDQADLLPTGRGVLSVYVAPTGTLSVWCNTTISPVASDTARDALSCDASLRRCVLERRVFLFHVRAGRRELSAVVSYPGPSVPSRDPPEVARAITQRDRVCELHDRVQQQDPSLASDDLWILPSFYEGDEPMTHLCGDAALRRSREAVRELGVDPLVCTELYCAVALDATSEPHVVARRDGGRLRLSVDGMQWIAGTELSPRDRRRIDTERCAAAPPRSSSSVQPPPSVTR